MGHDVKVCCGRATIKSRVVVPNLYVTTSYLRKGYGVLKVILYTPVANSAPAGRVTVNPYFPLDLSMDRFLPLTLPDTQNGL